MSETADSSELGRDVLRDVSRSFYLSLRLLPSPVRSATSCAYLLARLSDTLADTSTAPAEMRAAWLQEFREIINDPTRPPNLYLPSEAIAFSHQGEERLLARRQDIVLWFRRLPEDEKRLIQRVLQPIIEGQTADLSRTAVATAEELDHYTWQVAGCVGEFWTRLHFLRIPRFATKPEAEMVQLGIRYGKGLQLINVLRDVPKDLALGRCYLPSVNGTTDHSPKALWEAAQPWITQCDEHLAAGQQWVSAVRPWRCGLAARLPIAIARETLDLLKQTCSSAMTQPVKVPRRRVKWLLCQSAIESTTASLRLLSS